MPTQTPASRRFVLPSSTAPSRSQKQHGFGSQFSRPSHTSSSPFTRTPFSSTAQKQRKDDIVADDSEGSDEDGGDQNPDHALSRTDLAGNQPDALDVTDDYALFDNLQDAVPTRPIQTSQLPNFQSTQPHSSKRRKISHPTSENIKDDLDLSGPPSSPTRDHDKDRPPESELHVPRSSPPPANQDDASPTPLQNRSSSPTSSTPSSPAHDFQTPKHHKPRFRDPLPGLTGSTSAFNATPHPVVYPSFQSRLLASTTTKPTITSPGPHIRGPRPTLDLTLPDAFSPSRKRGAREYMYGGIAETVRGWVVDMATIVAGHNNTPVKSTNCPILHTVDDHTTESRADPTPTTDEESLAGKDKMFVKKVLLTDNSGRFVLIQSHPSSNSNSDSNKHNDTGETWMLINTDPQSRRTSNSSSSSSPAEAHSRLTAVQPGKLVNVRGGDTMTWELNTSLGTDMTDNLDQRVPTMCKVAVLWDVV